MKRLFWHWAISAIALVAAVAAVPGVNLAHWVDAVWIAPLLGLVNLVVGTVAAVISWIALPINLLSLGLFGFMLSFVLYTLAVYWLGNSAGPLHAAMPVDSLPAAMLLAAIMALISTLLNMIIPGARRKRK